MEPGFYTHNEIFSQPEAWADALHVVELAHSRLTKFLNRDYDQVLFTGCGSTYYLSLSAAALFQEMTGKLARAVPAGELLLYPETSLPRKTRSTLLVAISRSGSTTETIRAVEQFKDLKLGPVLAVTNYGDQPLAGLSDLPLVIEKGQERSVAQTRSFSSMFVATTVLTVLAAQAEDLRLETSRLPAVGETLLAKYASMALEMGENLDFDRYYFLGSGARYGLACEANLKMKEMSLTHSEPFHFFEFRHGPKSMVTDSAAVVGLLSQKNTRQEQAVLDEMQALGGQVLTLGDLGTQVAFHSGLTESVRNILYLPILQLMAFYRSLAKGLDPDRPRNLTAVVLLE